MTRQQLLWLFIWMFIFFLFFCIWSKLPTASQSDQNITKEHSTQVFNKKMHLKLLKEDDSVTISGLLASEHDKDTIINAYEKVFQTVHTGGLVVDESVQSSLLVNFFANFAENFSKFDTGYAAYNDAQLEIDGTASQTMVSDALQEQLSQLKDVSIDNTFVLQTKAQETVKIPDTVANDSLRVSHGLQSKLDALLADKRVQFLYARDILTRQSKTLLDAVVDLLKNENVKIEIAGHTDSDGTEEDNLRLSQKRAKRIKIYMVSKGMDEKNLQAVGYGESHPLVNNDTLTNRRLNRRVEFKIIGEQ